MATQEQRKAQTRAALLDAAGALFAADGYHATSAEAVAAAADRTTGALAAHFTNKAGLLLALLERQTDAALAEIGDALDAAVGVDGEIDAVWERFTDPHGTPPGAWPLLEHELWSVAARDSELAELMAERLAAHRAGLAEGVRRWSADEGLPTPGRRAAERRAGLVLALLLGLQMQAALDPSVVDDELVRDGVRRLAGLPT
jgi:AcrR family transcriptional regulator